jgi:hypothetical protein
MNVVKSALALSFAATTLRALGSLSLCFAATGAAELLANNTSDESKALEITRAGDRRMTYWWRNAVGFGCLMGAIVLPAALYTVYEERRQGTTGVIRSGTSIVRD